MGGRASQQWGVRVLNPGRGMLWSPPAPPPSTEVVEVVEVVEPIPLATDIPVTTDVTVDAVISLRRWLVRILARVTITRRKS
jgi:hypothetical protein